jgi:Mor family transcriptional regulator
MSRRKVLSDDQVREIRKEHMAYIRGRGYRKLAEKYGCGQSTIRDIITFRARQSVL